MIRKRVVIRGHVQGVFFRARCHDEASRNDVTGWVVNHADGTVEAVFEGKRAAVDKLVAWSERGPRKSRVDGVDVFDEEPEHLTDFVIRH